MASGIDRVVLNFRASGILAQVVFIVPVIGWPYRSRVKSAVAGGANILQHVLDA